MVLRRTAAAASAASRIVRRGEFPRGRGSPISPSDIDYAIALGNRYARTLHGFDLDEVPGIALLALAEVARRWRPDRGATLKTLAHYRIVGAILDTHRRRNGRQSDRWHLQVPLEEWQARGDLTVVDAMDASAQIWLILPALASLDVTEQELVLAEATGVTLDDVGDRHGITKSWACRRRQNARGKLQEMLGQRGALEAAG